MCDYNVSTSKGCAALLSVYAIAAVTEPKQDEPQINAHDFIYKQAKDTNCREASHTVGLCVFAYNYDKNTFLTQTTNLDGALLKVRGTLLKTLLLHPVHYPQFVGHPCKTTLYDNMRRLYYLPHFANGVYMTVRECSEHA